MTSATDSSTAFNRNLGWVTRPEQESLARRKVAVLGLGGAGGHHAMVLARLGVGAFHVADPDVYEWKNANRQTGAFASTIGQFKREVMGRLIRDVNPQAVVKEWADPFSGEQLDAFLEGVDVALDAIDFFCLPERRRFYAACRAKGIPVVMACPLGTGASVAVFGPTAQSADEYFAFDDWPEEHWPLVFLVGISPTLLHRSYIAAPDEVNFATHQVPSLSIGAQMCGALAGTEVFRLLLGREPPPSRVEVQHYDPYLRKFKRTSRSNRSWLSRLLIHYAIRKTDQWQRTAALPAGSGTKAP